MHVNTLIRILVLENNKLASIRAFLFSTYTRILWSEFRRVDVWFENDSGKRMIRSSFLSSAERFKLEGSKRSQREDHGVARRENAILLLDDGKSCQVTAEFLYLNDDTIPGWHKTYRESGWDTLTFDGWKGGQSCISADHEATLCGWLNDSFCRSIVEIRAHILKKFDPRYSHSCCIRLLARLGFEYRKPKALPRVAFKEKQANFNIMYQRLMTELGADEAVYFADAVHPEYQKKPAYGWVKAGSNPAVPTTAGRGRVNIHGAIKFESPDAPFVAPTTVDGISAAQLVAKI
jgi:transposase